MRQVLFFQVIGVVLGIVQVAAIAAQLHSYAGVPYFLNGIAGFFLATIPLVGGLVGFFGAVDVWHWHWGVAAAVMFLGGWGAIILSWVVARLFRYDDQ